MRETRRADDTEPVAGEAANAMEAMAPGEARRIQPEMEPAAGTWAGRLTDWAARHPRAPLALALLLSLAARALLVARAHAMIDGDEALVGIQAERILHGQYPIYFYGQPYMGSLEAYFAAAIFRVFGPSAWALRVVPILLSLLLVYLTWRLAHALLPKGARTTPLLAGLAAFVAAAPPLYDAIAELRTWGGQIEVYVVTLALLLVTVELADRLRTAAGAFEIAWRWMLWGFLLGLGIWINPLISYAAVACVLWLLPALGVREPHPLPPLPWGEEELKTTRAVSGTEWEAAGPAARAESRGSRLHAGALGLMLAVLPGLAIGGLPAWIYAARNAGTNLLVYVTQPAVSPAVSGAARHGRLFLGAAITARYMSCVGPNVLDGNLPTGPLTELPLRYLLLLPALAGIACAFWVATGRGGYGKPLRVGLPLLYGAVITLVFCLGTSAWAATKSCASDWAGRYAVPLALVEPFLLLALFAAPGVWLVLRTRQGKRADAGRARIVRHGWTLALAVLLVAGAAQLGTYALANPATTFQSPFYQHVGMDQQPLLAYLRAHDIRYAWANHWVGNIVTFETDGQTSCADYYDEVYSHGLHRPPGVLEAVSAANAPSFILALVDPHPLLARELDQLGIPYTLALIPASGVTVITPARTVDPAMVIPGLGQDYAP
ncbi:MAG TPA: hypothetical protein VKQ30_12625 [Ktedonobacterales bacterium]|nr:hypothetical protein [Ktedonobacterales bacterium]